jgi:hypothetical protein
MIYIFTYLHKEGEFTCPGLSAKRKKNRSEICLSKQAKIYFAVTDSKKPGSVTWLKLPV